MRSHFCTYLSIWFPARIGVVCRKDKGSVRTRPRSNPARASWRCQTRYNTCPTDIWGSCSAGDLLRERKMRNRNVKYEKNRIFFGKVSNFCHISSFIIRKMKSSLNVCSMITRQSVVKSHSADKKSIKSLSRMSSRIRIRF